MVVEYDKQIGFFFTLQIMIIVFVNCTYIKCTTEPVVS